MLPKKIKLRKVVLSDLEQLLDWENNTLNWEVSGTTKPYTIEEMSSFISNGNSNIFDSLQLRLIICFEDQTAIGTIDFFDFDPYHLRAGIGILINDEKNRNQGYANQALKAAIQKAKEEFNLTQLYCDIDSLNISSIKLFEKNGFSLSGIKRKWMNCGGMFKDIGFYQLIF